MSKKKQFVYSQNQCIVDTDKGAIRGYLENGIYNFKGIPYGKAKRFHAPEEADPWDKVKECTSYGCVCPLLGNDKPNGELMVPHRYWVMDEDCLNLNVWTPGLDDKKRPVMVWLHGGGFEAGSSIEQIAYEGYNMAGLGDVVVVSINHRLNVLGYMDFSDFGPEYEDSGNNGTNDIIMALKWINKNIAGFGGNPENVIVFGQSGGGAKVTTLLQTPAADGLYHAGINMSGVITPLIQDKAGSGKDMAEAMMAELAVSSMKELEEVEYSALAAAYKKCRDILGPQGKNVGGAPHPNKHYAGDPLVVGFREETKDIPLLVGSVFGEFSSFGGGVVDKHSLSEEDQMEYLKGRLKPEALEALLPMFKEAYPEREICDLPNIDFLFRIGELDYTVKRGAMNDCTWVYMFNQDMNVDGGRTPWHCSDIPYVFHNVELVPIGYVEGVSEKLEEQIFSTVMAFAHTHNPNNDMLPQWDCTKAEAENVMIFDANTRQKTNYDRALVPAAMQHIGFMWPGADDDAQIQH